MFKKSLIIAMAIMMTLCCVSVSFAENDEFVKEINGVWELRYFSDKFESPTDEYFIVNCVPFEGKFSNSVTTGSPLSVLLSCQLVEGDGDVCLFTMKLFEYKSNLVKNSYPDTRFYDVEMKDGNGDAHSLTGILPSGWSQFGFIDNDRDVILAALKKGGCIKFYLEESSKPITNYLFTIENADGFAEMYDKLFEQ